MAFDSGKAKDVFYQYFWVKVATAAQVDSQRKGQMMSGPDSNGFFFPMISDVVPPAKPRKPLTIASQKMNVHVGFEIKPQDAASAGYLLDLRAATPGYTLAEARKWIGTPAGQAWAGGALVVLCFVAIEPLPKAPRKRPAAPARKKSVASKARSKKAKRAKRR